MKFTHDKRLLYQTRTLSLKIKEAQKHVRILSNVRWNSEFEAKYMSQSGPPTLKSLRFKYEPDSLRFSADDVLRRLAELREEVDTKLTEIPWVKRILENIISDFENVTHLLMARGRPEFGDYSRRLWGSAHDEVFSNGRTLFKFVENFKENLERISDEETEKMFPKVLSAEAMVELLKRRLSEAHLLEQISVMISDKLVSDAAAGGNYIKIRKGALFSVKDVDVFVYHEAFTHIATSLNGRNQTFAQWLSYDSPRCTSTQEGLAVLMEMLSGRTYPGRLRRIIDRILMLGMIEEGTKPSILYDKLRTDGYSHRDALVMIMRGYRGSDPESQKPFTKDVSYLKGLIECFNFVQTSLIDNRYDDIPTLYAGKLAVAEVPALVKGIEQGIVMKPKWVPSVLLDLDSLSGWFTYVTALGNMGDRRMRDRFREERKLWQL